MTMVACPHCGAENAEGSEFCEQCGKALPSSAPTGPRVVRGKGIAATATGQTVQANQLRKQARSAAMAMFLVAILQVIAGLLMYYLISHTSRVDPEVAAKTARTVLVVVCVLAGAFAGLGCWALVSPLPAAIVGLVLFLTLAVADAVVSPRSIIQGIIIKLVIVIVLVKAVRAGVRYKQLREQMRTSAATA